MKRADADVQHFDTDHVYARRSVTYEANANSSGSARLHRPFGYDNPQGHGNRRKRRKRADRLGYGTEGRPPCHRILWDHEPRLARFFAFWDIVEHAEAVKTPSLASVRLRQSLQ